MSALTEAQAAWLAAAIDGEGVVGLHRNNKASGHVYWIAHVEVTNTNEAFAERARDFMLLAGARAVQWHVMKPGPRSKLPCYRPTVQAQADVEFVLRAVLPWLVIKHDRAELILNWIGERKIANARGEIKFAHGGASNRSPYGEETERVADALRTMRR